MNTTISIYDKLVKKYDMGLPFDEEFNILADKCPKMIDEFFKTHIDNDCKVDYFNIYTKHNNIKMEKDVYKQIAQIAKLCVKEIISPKSRSIILIMCVKLSDLIDAYVGGDYQDNIHIIEEDCPSEALNDLREILGLISHSTYDEKELSILSNDMLSIISNLIAFEWFWNEN